MFKKALQHYIAGLEKPADWLTVLLRMQAILNNSTSGSTSQSLNKVLYRRKVIKLINLLQTPNSVTEASTHHIDLWDAINFTNMQVKQHYNRKYTAMFLKVEDYTHLHLHWGYILPVIKKNSKLTQQFVSLFKVIHWVERLVYKLDILPN